MTCQMGGAANNEWICLQYIPLSVFSVPMNNPRIGAVAMVPDLDSSIAVGPGVRRSLYEEWGLVSGVMCVLSTCLFPHCRVLTYQSLAHPVPRLPWAKLSSILEARQDRSSLVSSL